PGRVGLAAGMDKDGTAVLAWQALGFSFAEVGTVTAQPQPGNPKPRVFRLRSSRALINRMGFNNAGAAAIARELALRGVYRGNRAAGIPIGISIGKTKVVPVQDAVEDYLASFRLVAPHADYLAVNVSSPNTPGLRTLQDGGALGELLAALTREATLRAGNAEAPLPIWVKIAPDLTGGQIDEVLGACSAAGVSGVIATNTTLSRDGLASKDRPLAAQDGGLSGAPLTARARQVVDYVTRHTDLPVMGVGGIMTADDALALLDAGASLVQLYTGFIYSGPALTASIERALAARSAGR
ncbi:MAG: quinone-dependent dihydroorotate dehydrogenase, partial [Micropruina sp.]